jgi:hypothetical protein
MKMLLFIILLVATASSFAEKSVDEIDNGKGAIEFRFDAKDGGLTNKFSFDPETKSWTSLIRQEEKGEWKTFAEDKITRLEKKQ